MIPTFELTLTTDRKGAAILRIGTGRGARKVRGMFDIISAISLLMREGREAWREIK